MDKTLRLDYFFSELEKTVRDNQFRRQWGALKQTCQFFRDLLFFHQKKSSVSKISPEKIYTHVALKAFYSIEQTLTYLNLALGNNRKPVHAIKVLMRGADKIDLINEPIINKIYCANFWGAYPHDQLHKWKKLERKTGLTTPVTLTNINKLSENEKMDDLNHKIDEVFEQTIDFMTKLLHGKLSQTSEAVNEAESTLLSSNIIDLTVRDEPFSIERKNLLMLSKAILERIQESDHLEHGVLRRLKQSMHSFSFLIEILLQLESEQIKKQEAGIFIRNCIFWFNNMVENYLLSKQIENFNDHTWSHRIADLLAITSNASEEDILFMHGVFREINNDVRYPYEPIQIRSALHELVLQADEGLSAKQESAILIRKLNDLIEKTCGILINVSFG